mgnify:CR=1 FL=1
MPPDQETPIPEETSQPTAAQEPTPEAPIFPSTSEPIATPPVAPEAPTEAESAIPVTSPSYAEATAGRDNERSSLETAPMEQPAHADAPPSHEAADGQSEAVADRQIENPSVNEAISEAQEIPTAHSERNEPLLKASISSVVGNAAKQERVRKKLENIIELLNTKGKVTNDEIEKLLHVSDATATRYLSQLEKEGKIKQEGRTGKSVSYSRI